MMKKLKKITLTLLATFMFFGVFAATVTGASRSVTSNSGQHRSGWFTLTDNSRRSARIDWSHERFTISTRTSNIQRGNAATASSRVEASNGVVTQLSWRVNAGGNAGASVTRIALVRPSSWGALTN